MCGGGNELATKSGKTVGQYACNSVVAAAKYLAKLPYIDGKHMGLRGHSFGGSETNFLVTHTKLFKAASEMAGPSDQISGYLTLLPTNNNKEDSKEQQSIREYGQIRFAATLWQKPDFYIRESSVLYADRVTTPLLMIHNKNDDGVQFRQGVEFFMALRHLNKRVWMLQYDNGNHFVSGQDSVDYTIRLTQFFDHYLKETLPPVWLTEGVPAYEKGIRSGYELDKSGKTP
ncbi:MAG: prolyl oligopeptidase family serine peptidase [Chitinophagaceae bacterium]